MDGTVSHLRNLFDVGQILGFHSCNGLVAIALNSKNGDCVEFFVYNPATRHSRLIPLLDVHDVYVFYDYDPDTYEILQPITCPQAHKHFVALNIVFDPLQSDRYMLVYVWMDNSDYCRIAIYASDTMVWMDSECRIPIDFEQIYFENGILWNGDLHWAAERWFTLCLDFENGREKPMPASFPLPREKEVHVYWPVIFFFGKCGGDLCLIGLKEPKSLLFDVFKLELDYSRWEVKCCLDLYPLTTFYPSMADELQDPYYDWWRCKFSVLNCVVDKKKKKLVLMISLPHKVISCDMDDVVAKEIADVVPEDTQDATRYMSRYEWMEAFQHVETFASV